jgi:hypothetical protein
VRSSVFSLLLLEVIQPAMRARYHVSAPTTGVSSASRRIGARDLESIELASRWPAVVCSRFERVSLQAAFRLDERRGKRFALKVDWAGAGEHALSLNDEAVLERMANNSSTWSRKADAVSPRGQWSITELARFRVAARKLEQVDGFEISADCAGPHRFFGETITWSCPPGFGRYGGPSPRVTPITGCSVDWRHEPVTPQPAPPLPARWLTAQQNRLRWTEDAETLFASYARMAPSYGSASKPVLDLAHDLLAGVARALGEACDGGRCTEPIVLHQSSLRRLLGGSPVVLRAPSSQNARIAWSQAGPDGESIEASCGGTWMEHVGLVPTCDLILHSPSLPDMHASTWRGYSIQLDGRGGHISVDPLGISIDGELLALRP